MFYFIFEMHVKLHLYIVFSANCASYPCNVLKFWQHCYLQLVIEFSVVAHQPFNVDLSLKTNRSLLSCVLTGVLLINTGNGL